jgi:hypothetical protein
MIKDALRSLLTLAVINSDKKLLVDGFAMSQTKEFTRGSIFQKECPELPLKPEKEGNELFLCALG